MIIFKELKETNRNNLLIYEGYDNETLIGECRVKIEGKIAYLESLHINEEHRGSNLGEGLLRSILNKLDKLGIERVSFDGKNSYLIKKGFIEEDRCIYVDLPNFFNYKCKSCDKRNGEIENEI